MTVENLLAGGAIIGVINAIQMTFPQIKGLWAFLVAVILGVAMGLTGYFGVNGIEEGLLLALSSSGVYKLSQNPKKPQ